MDLNNEISANRFLKISFLISLSIILLIITVNVMIDIYGLFRPVKGKAIPVYHNERVSKYLLSYRYIPENFNTVIIGTSLSANLDVTPYNRRKGRFRIYNASIMGTNITELNPVATNIVKGGVQYVILCLSPYLTKNTGFKEVVFDRKVYAGALGSKNLFETYAIGLIRELDLLPGKFPKDQINSDGVNHYNDLYQVDDVQQKIAEVIEGNKDETLTIDPAALNEFKALIRLLNENHIRYIGYFHPVPAEILESKREDYERFEKTVRGIIGDDNKLIDLNSPEFNFFTSDYTNYIDHGHLSVKGQNKILNILYARMEELH